MPLPPRCGRSKPTPASPSCSLTQRALHLRRRRPECFCAGTSYEPLTATGPKAAHAVAFVRGGDIVAVAPRLVLGLAGDWAGTTLTLPPGRFEDVLDGGKRTFEGEVALGRPARPVPGGAARACALTDSG